MANQLLVINTTNIAPFRPMIKWRRIVAVLAITACMAAACGSSAVEPVQVDSSNSDSEESESAESDSAQTSEPVADTIDRSGMRVITYPALGGVRLAVPTDVLVSSEGELVTMRREGSGGVAIFARTSQAAGQDTAIVTVDDFVSVAQAATGATVTVTDESVIVFGNELIKHQFRDATPPQGPGVFGSRAFEFTANVWWTPAPAADVYLAEIDGGVLVLAATGPDEEAVAAALTIIDDVVPTIELLTASGNPKSLPLVVNRYVPIGEPLDFAPAMLDPDGAPEFTALFAPVEPGEYQMGNLSLPITISPGPGWFTALNFPTFVVITELPLVGPGFRDIVFQQGVNAIGGVNHGVTLNTPTVPIADIEVFLETAPSQLDISNINTQATLGGLDAVQFDLLIDRAATCQPNDPCEYVFTSAQLDFVTMINPGVVHRTWWIDDVPAGPLVIVASTSEADSAWLDSRAEELLSTLVFGTNE